MAGRGRCVRRCAQKRAASSECGQVTGKFAGVGITLLDLSARLVVDIASLLQWVMRPRYRPPGAAASVGLRRRLRIRDRAAPQAALCGPGGQLGPGGQAELV